MKGNKIIAISGQPVTGKGTTVKALVEKLKAQGYSEENIHVMATGHEFRNYFAAIFKFIKEYENPEQIENFKQNEYLKLILEKQEYRDALINTILKLKQNQIDVNSLTIENANNLKEFSELRKAVDYIIDTKDREEGMKINHEEKPNEVWIVDSRLAFYNIPEAFSVRLISDPQVAAKRYINDTNRRKDDNYLTFEEAYDARERRRIGEQKRYIKRYGVDLEDENNYDLIIDTSYSSVEDNADIILKCLDCYNNEKPFAKTWTSPKTLIPFQREKDTLGAGGMQYDLEEFVEKIRKEGYNPESAIEVIEVEGIRYIIEGHHRNFASSILKNTLVPYKVIAKDDENIPYYPRTARERANELKFEYLQGHEWMIENKFSYKEIYPELYQKTKERDNEDGSR